MTTPTPCALRPLSDRLADALTIALSASDLLEQLALGRLERSADNLDRVAESLHQAASLISPDSHQVISLEVLTASVKTAHQMLSLINSEPALFNLKRKLLILSSLYGAADRFAMIDLANTANQTEAHG